MSSPSSVLWLFSLALFAAGLAGCGQQIGDACETALDFSSLASRLCDRTQPHGYCTIRGCEKGTCPEESVCVKFRPAQERLAFTYCMYECDDNSDCRDDEGYECASASDFGATGEALILGSAKQRFCVARPRKPDATDVLMSMPPEPTSSDSGASDVSEPSTDSSDADGG
jgi:hypothetical protein